MLPSSEKPFQSLSELHIREVRRTLGWSQVELAKRARLSLGTIKAAEQGEKPASLKTKSILCEIPEFYSVLDKILIRPTDGLCQMLRLPGYSSFMVYRSIQSSIENKSSPYPDDAYYCDDSDIELNIATQNSFVNQMALNSMSNSIKDVARLLKRREIGKPLIRLICPTCGYGWYEFVLAKLLVEQGICCRANVSIIHNSATFLFYAFKRAEKELALYPNLVATFFLGHREKLALSQSILAKSTDEREMRLFFLQSVLFNYDKSRDLIRSMSTISHSGDLLLFDVSVAPTDNLSMRSLSKFDIRMGDEYYIANELLYRDMVTSSLLSFDANICNVSYFADTVRHPERLGSLARYAISLSATIAYRKGGERKISTYRIYRYNIDQLIAMLNLAGWRFVDVVPFGQDIHPMIQSRWMLFMRE